MYKTRTKQITIFLLGLVLILTIYVQGCQNRPRLILQSAPAAALKFEDSSGRHLIPDRWWETAAGIKLVTLKKGRSYAHEISIDPVKASEELDEIKAQGFQVIEIFAPAEGLFAYSGLDTTNFYRIDPEIGTMDDFRQFVRIAHSKGIAVIVFINIGYFSIEAPDWIEACTVKGSEKAKWFWWADKADAPIPPEHPYFNWPRPEGYDRKTWGWQYSELAGRYFWARWRAKDKEGNYIGLPQTNWENDEWPKEAGRIVRFWMDTGLDGMIIDAPIYYIGCTWEKNNRYITDIITSYGNTFRQPEGSKDVVWITEGGYNCLQDYGLRLWDNDVIMTAIEIGDPRPIEESLRSYHDIAVTAGGILYQTVRNYDDLAKRHLARATVAAVGDLVVYDRRSGSPDAEETWILKTKRLHPALHQLSTRRKLVTNADDKYYAFLRTAPDNSERILVVLNFQSTPQTVAVDLSGVDVSQLIDLRTLESSAHDKTFNVKLPKFGYRFFLVVPAIPSRRSVRQTRHVGAPDSSLTHLIPDCWWKEASAIRRVTLRQDSHYQQLSLEPGKLSKQLDEIVAQGFQAVEIFAPADGGKSYGGLDSKNRYRIDPELGTMDDFRRLVRLAHSKGLAITTFDNLGYCAIDAPHFLKACDDVREGRDSDEVKWFCWSRRANGPLPAQGNNFFMIRPTHLPGWEPGTLYDPVPEEFWELSDRANCYYWTKWEGKDENGNEVRLPQYNWNNIELQREAERIVRFWMDTGLDGMVIDAVNWYIGCTWEMNRRYLTDVIASYGNQYIQPEGAGAFHEDPVAWITEGGWNSVQDYGLGIWWEKGSDVIANAIESGNPRPIEPALRGFHDRVVAEGGVLYYALRSPYENAQKQHLVVATVATVGDIPVYSRYTPDAEETWILKTKRLHPALHQLSTRRKLVTNADEKYYAFLKTAADKSERILVVLNYQSSPQTIEIDMSGVATSGLLELKYGELITPKSHFKAELPVYGNRFYQSGLAAILLPSLQVELPAYGYRFYQILPAKRLP